MNNIRRIVTLISIVFCVVASIDCFGQGKMFGSDNTSAWAISISKGTMVKGISNTAQGMILRYTGQMVRPVSK